jgi:hypothetical protein
MGKIQNVFSHWYAVGGVVRPELFSSKSKNSKLTACSAGRAEHFVLAALCDPDTLMLAPSCFRGSFRNGNSDQKCNFDEVVWPQRKLFRNRVEYSSDAYMIP